jgi:3-deoxy-D-manno-octulosonic acid kinase
LTETVEKTATGAILYDKAIINQISEERFRPEGWLHSEPLTGSLRSADRYLWTGEDNTRSFVEWRLLEKLAVNDLRVPRPAAARYCRKGPFYTADIITVRIPAVKPLSQFIAEKARDEEFWQSVGQSIREFHAAGVFHADMNAYNLQIDTSSRLWMLDFDRGRLLQPGEWQQKTLNRLHRSLVKIKTLDPGVHFDAGNWDALLAGYFNASRSA